MTKKKEFKKKAEIKEGFTFPDNIIFVKNQADYLKKYKTGGSKFLKDASQFNKMNFNKVVNTLYLLDTEENKKIIRELIE